jgi:hypothetical protein
VPSVEQGRPPAHCDAAVHCTPTGAWHTPSPQINPSALAQQSSSVVQDALLVQRVQHCM